MSGSKQTIEQKYRKTAKLKKQPKSIGSIVERENNVFFSSNSITNNSCHHHQSGLLALSLQLSAINIGFYSSGHHALS